MFGTFPDFVASGCGPAGGDSTLMFVATVRIRINLAEVGEVAGEYSAYSALSLFCHLETAGEAATVVA